MIFTNLIEANLKTNTIGKHIEYYTRLESTNNEAWELINEGMPSGTLIITDNQISGKGRKGNEWKSQPGKSLTFSIIYQPKKLPIDKIGLLSIITGISILDGLKELNVNAGLKWPNDILFDGAKLAGILVEIIGGADPSLKIIVGVGIILFKKDIGFGVCVSIHKPE